MVTVVIGTGRMGPGIAAAAAKTGTEVRIVGRDADRARRAAEIARGFSGDAASLIKSGLIEPGSMVGADLVIETITEDAQIKCELFQLIEPWIDANTILATNTSSLGIDRLASVIARPDRFIGFHFLNPAQITAVVEVVPGSTTDESTTSWLTDFGREMGKTPLLVHYELPGFIWNRLQFALLRECVHLLEEGVADVEAIDAAVSDGLAPRWVASGPLATADMGGVQTFAVVASQLYPSLCNDTEPQRALEERGRTGERFYRWTAQSEREVAELRHEHLMDSLLAIKRRRGAMPPAG